MDYLTPVFVAGFAVQQFLEIFTTVLNLDANATFEKYKKVILGITSIALGFLLAARIPALRVLQTSNVSDAWNLIITAFVLSAGTEGVNSILKFVKYAKEDKKATAASKDPLAAADVAAPGIPTASALQRINRT